MRRHLQVPPLCALGCTAVTLYGYFITVWLSNGLMRVQCSFRSDTGLPCARWVLHTEDIGSIMGNIEITPWEVECVGMSVWKKEGVERTYIIAPPPTHTHRTMTNAFGKTGSVLCFSTGQHWGQWDSWRQALAQCRKDSVPERAVQ